MKKFLIGLLILIALLAASWVVTSGVIWFICICFSLEFSLKIATGIWLILCLLQGIFGGKS